MSDRVGARPPGARAALVLAWLTTLLMGSGVCWAQAGPTSYTVVGDGIPAALTSVPGDALAGRRIVLTRSVGLCLLCHSGPFPEERFQGDLAPSLAGAGARWSAAQLRLRLVDSRRVQADSIMPAYHRTQGLVRVGTAWQDKPILSAQQVEDVLAFLLTLRD